MRWISRADEQEALEIESLRDAARNGSSYAAKILVKKYGFKSRFETPPDVTLGQLQNGSFTTYEGGDLLEFHGVAQPAKGGGLRGAIETFSPDSRKRMKRSVAKVNKELAGFPSFLTVTYGESCPTDPREWKNHLKNFWAAFRRRYPEAFAIWRLEFQEDRVSELFPAGVPHFHFLIFKGPRIIRRKGANQTMFNLVRRLWCKIIGGNANEYKASTRMEMIYNRKGVFRYMSKYLSKVDQAGRAVIQNVGRFWGWLNRNEKANHVQGVEHQASRADWWRIKGRALAWLIEKLEKHVMVGHWEGLSVFVEPDMWRVFSAGFTLRTREPGDGQGGLSCRKPCGHF